jgi:hypothetical protein
MEKIFPVNIESELRFEDGKTSVATLGSGVHIISPVCNSVPGIFCKQITGTTYTNSRKINRHQHHSDLPATTQMSGEE